MIVDPDDGRADMAEPVLNAGDVGAVLEGDGGGRGLERMGAKADDLICEPGGLGMGMHQAVDGVGMQRFFEITRGPVPERAEQSSLEIGAMATFGQIGLDSPDCLGMGRLVLDLAALALDTQEGGALALLAVTDLQATELGTAQAVEEEGGEDGAVALALEAVGVGGVEQFSC